MSKYDFEKLNNLPENDITTTDTTVRKGNVLAAILAGLFSCIAFSSVWALITIPIMDDLEEKWLFTLALAGWAVGWFVKIVSGANNNTTIGFIGALFALLSCVLGDFFIAVGFIAKNEGLTFFQTLGALDFSHFFEIAFWDFGFLRIFIYGAAAVAGLVFGRGTN